MEVYKDVDKAIELHRLQNSKCTNGYLSCLLGLGDHLVTDTRGGLFMYQLHYLNSTDLGAYQCKMCNTDKALKSKEE